MDQKQRQKTIVISAMHRRQRTVKYCLDKMPFIDKVMVYTENNDGLFLDNTDVVATAQVPNEPLSLKWHMAIRCLDQLEFDAVILLGSDDYIDRAFLNFVEKEIQDCDMIGFTDAYYENGKDKYYWKGYQNHRKGEPVGAGKVYSRKFLERIDFNLYPYMKNVGLDYMAWKVVQEADANVKIFSLKEEGLKMVNVKNGKGMNSIEKLTKTLEGFEKL